MRGKAISADPVGAFGPSDCLALVIWLGFVDTLCFAIRIYRCFGLIAACLRVLWYKTRKTNCRFGKIGVQASR